jgi:hypothetical protein
MGMVWVARLANQDQTAEIMANPDSTYDFINPEEGYGEGGEADVLDLDKEWHGAHHLLTGSAERVDDPLGLILANFEEVGEDNGYGPAWYVSPDRLRAFHEASSALDATSLRDRYDPDAMAREQVYLGDMYQAEGDEGFGFLLERIETLRRFAARAAASGRGAFAVIT